jgi:hypothetical protein
MNIGRTAIVVSSVLAVALVGALALGAYAFAQADGGGPPWFGGAGWHDGDRGPGRWSGGPFGADPEHVRAARADLAADLAPELDTSAERVEAAFRAVAAQRLQEAAEAGQIDEASVDEALAAYDEGDVRALFRILKPDRDRTTESS